jgi:membrane protein DedA with SNARE-associated domain
MMAIESSFIPFPSEIVLVPAGYLASKGDMSISYIMMSAIAGSIIGSFVNYYLAFTLGRKFLLRYGKYFFISPEVLEKMERYFKKHGHISTFTGRLIPGVRQLISIPAGIAKMNLLEFTSFTLLGAGIWALILTLLGYFIGENQELIKEYLKEITILVIGLLVILGALYYRYQKKKEL